MKAILKLAGREYVGEGDDVRSAIKNIEFHGFAREKSVLTIGEKSIVLSVMQSQRIFAPNPTIREVNIKSISLRF